MARRRIVLSLALLLSACAAEATTIPAGSPANPAGPEAPSETAAVSSAERPPAAPATTGGMGGMGDMGGMGGMQGMPGMVHDGGAVAPSGSAAPGTVYACPMHPEVTSPTPGRCPKCGMQLEPRTPDAGTR